MFLTEKIAKAIIMLLYQFLFYQLIITKKTVWRTWKNDIWKNFKKLRKFVYFKKWNSKENHLTEIRVSGIDFYKNLNREKFTKFWSKFSDNVSAGDPIERWDTYFNPPHPDINSPCNAIWERMYVWWDGLCNPCDADYKSYLSYGDASKDKIKNIWKSEKVTKLRKDHLSNKRNCHNPCDRCSVDYGS